MEQIFDFRLIFVCLISILVNILNTATSASRISGVETKRIATSISLFNLFQLFARLSNLFYVPVMGTIVDLAVRTGNLHLLLVKMHYIVFSATIGSLLGFLLLPTFVELYIRGINAFERRGSLFMVILGLLYPPNTIKIFKAFRKPSFLGLKSLSLKGLPKSFLFFNIFVIAIWTVGVLSATYASALVPEFARTATLLSGLVNGIATILLTLLVDPIAAMITDQAAHNQRPMEHVKVIVVYIVLGNIIGTILSQFILYPGAEYIAWATKLITK